MKNKTYLLNTLLALVLGLALLIIVLMRSFLPMYIVPRASIPNLVLLSLVALLLDHYLAPGAKRCYVCIPLFALISFALLPWAAGYVLPAEIWKLALLGCVSFTVTTLFFTTIQDRLSSGPSAKAAPVISALELYLAAQCLNGFFG